MVFWTRVRFSPPPPKNKKATLLSGFFIFVEVARTKERSELSMRQTLTGLTLKTAGEEVGSVEQGETRIPTDEIVLSRITRF